MTVLGRLDQTYFVLGLLMDDLENMTLHISVEASPCAEDPDAPRRSGQHPQSADLRKGRRKPPR